jgi:very-short-patch-repair endonuclease
MIRRKIIPYDPKLKELARQLRNDSTKTEIFLWLKLKGKQMYGYDFHRQKPIDNYILDFFCYELMLGIEVDGYSHQFLEVYNKDGIKEKRMNQLGISVLRFSDEQVLKDMEHVIRVIENYIIEYEEHTPNPSQEGSQEWNFIFLSTKNTPPTPLTL